MVAVLVVFSVGLFESTIPLPSKVAVVDPPKVRRITSVVAVAVAPTMLLDADKVELSTVPAAPVNALIVTPLDAPTVAETAPVFN